MSKSRLTITVPEPCHEDWNTMTRQDQGRFCSSCQKTVVDFTSMTDAEVVRWLTKQKGNTCGRFTKKQLARELIASNSSRQSWTWKALALGLSAWISAKSAEAKNFSSPVHITHPSHSSFNQEVQPASLLASDSLVVIAGVVLDSETNQPIEGATVVLKGTTIGSPTDKNGKFSISMPASVLKETAVLTFNYIGYRPIERLARTVMVNPSITLAPGQKNELTTGIVAIAIDYKWYSPRGLYYRVRNLFH